jgi:hypothetical protein
MATARRIDGWLGRRPRGRRCRAVARSGHLHEPGGSIRLVQETDSLTGDDVLPGFRLLLAAFFAL